MKKLNRILSILMCILLLSMSLAACSGGGQSEEGTDPEAQPETTTVRLALSSNGHVFNAIAEDQGYLKDEGITVKYVPVENDIDAFYGIENGTIDIASNQGTNLPLQRLADGQDLTIFAGYLLTGCMPVFAKVDTKWEGIDDMIGKTVACEPNLYAITGALLDKGYKPLSDVTWLETETQEERIEAVKSGKADFGLVGTSLNYAINNDPDLKVCTYASDVMPNYSCCRVEASTEWVNANPNTVKALLRAWIRAMAYYQTHHDEAVALMMKQTGQNEEFVRAYMDNPHCDFNIGPMKSSVERAWIYMYKLGILNHEAKKINIGEHINTQLYKEALDECQKLDGGENASFYEEMQGQYARNN